MAQDTPAHILITGGTGYIGSHACVSLLEAGYQLVVLDNCSNSDPAVIDQISTLSGKSLSFVQGDIRDRDVLDTLFRTYPIAAVMHFAGLKSVNESCADPLRYHSNNVHGSLTLFEAMQAAGVTRLIFSSSATVYGLLEQNPVDETCAVAPTNPYGTSKLLVEQILRDLARPDSCAVWQVALLRYFNPIGAHKSGLIGEHPSGTPNNLLPYLTQVAIGQREYLPVFGSDYPTPDGTGVRDYIHVMDLVEGHLLALQKLLATPTGTATCHTWNLGTGQGYSVLDMVKAFEQVNGVAVPYRLMPRRPGDVAACWADPSRATRELGWRASRDLNDMLTDSWRWQQHLGQTPK
jgi:UDP-glucose 4-epimerase